MSKLFVPPSESLAQANNTSNILKFIDLTHTLSPSSTPTYPGDPPFSLEPVFTHREHGVSVMKVGMTTHTGTHIDAPFHFCESGKTVDLLELCNSSGDGDGGGLIGKNVWMIDFTSPPQNQGEHANSALLERQCIEWSDIEVYLPQTRSDIKGRLVLFHTGWAKAHYRSGASNPSSSNTKYFAHPFLAADVALRLLELGVHIIGLDVPSPDATPRATDESATHSLHDADLCPCPTPAQETDLTSSIKDQYPFHIAFLSAGGVIVENMANLDLLARSIRECEPRTQRVTQHISDTSRRRRWLVSVVPLKLEGADGSPVRVFACAS